MDEGGKGVDLTLRKASVEEYVRTMYAAVQTVFKTRQELIGKLSFDKDDVLAVDFVTAAANLRAHNYGLPFETAFEIKDMAGNIVPAISSTNALVSGLMVAETIKLLLQRPNLPPRAVTYKRADKVSKLASSNLLNEPRSSSCLVCAQQKQHLQLFVRLDSFPLSALVEAVLKRALSISEPVLCDHDGNVLYEESEDLEEEE